MGVVSSKTSLAKQHYTATEAGFHRSWYPVCLARDLAAGKLIGRDFLGTRVVAYRDAAGKPVVQSAWCPHLGADLSVGQIVDGRLRCAYHHWSFDGTGVCAHIPSGDKIPSAARIFTYPSEEKWGLVWAFNGERADFPVPRIPDAEPDAIDLRALRARRAAVGHLGRRLKRRRLPAPAHPAWHTEGVDARGTPDRGGRHRFRVESPYHLQAGRISGTNTFAQHLRMAGQEMFMLFSGAPIEPGRSRGFFMVGVPKGQAERLRAGTRHGRQAERGGRTGAEHHPFPTWTAHRVGPPSRALLQVRRGVPLLPAADVARPS